MIVEINHLAESTRYNVTGTANLGAQTATLVVMPQVGTYSAGTTWTILQAAVGVNGEFAFTPPMLLPELMILHGMNDVQLFLPTSVLVGIPTQGLSGNTLITAKYLNSLVDVPFMQDVITDLMLLPTDTLIKALDAIDPLRISSSRFALFNTQLGFSDLVSSRMVNQRMLHHFSYPTMFAASPQNLRPEQLMASLSFDQYWDQTPCEQPKDYSVWFQGFGLFSHEVGEDTNPSFDTHSTGGLLAIDALLDSSLLGGGAGYAKTHLKQSSSLGRATAKSAFFVLYNAFYGDNFFLDWAFWNSYSRVKNRRSISFNGFEGVAKSTFDSWGITPHLTLGYTFWFCKGAIEPFVSLDWPIQINSSLDEKNAPPLNMHVQSNFSAMFRTELGLNFYEKLEWETGILIARQAVSYINKEPFSVGDVNAVIVGQPGSFTVETFQGTQHLFSPKAELFLKWDQGFFLSGMYQGEFGSGYRSNEIIGKIGCFF